MNKNVFVVAACVALALPRLSAGAATALQEYRDVTQSKPSLDRGAELFRTCLVCHGPTGQGVLDGGVPRIGGQHFSILVGQLVDYRHDKRWDPRMEHFADQHHLVNAQAISDVAAYVSQLQSTSEDGVGMGPGEFLAQGEGVYSRSCVSCHGVGGDGDARRAIPQVAGQHYEYLRRQIYDAVDGRRPNFSAAHVRLFGRLERDDITGVADFLSRMPRQIDFNSVQELAGTPR
jgi:cytochrome c553